MSAPTPENAGFEEYATVELRRAFAGRLSPEDVPEVVARALAHAKTYPSRLRRAANPVGYLYRAGTTESGVKGQPYAALDVDTEDLADHADTYRALQAMEADQAGAVWLVVGCDWTNVQAAEALASNPNQVGELVRKAKELLPPDGDVVLKHLVAVRSGRVPEQPSEARAEPVPIPHPPPSPTWSLKRILTYGVPALAALAVAAFLLLNDDSPDAEVETPEPAAAATERIVIERDDWTQPLDDASEPSTLVLARVGADDPVLAGNLARARTRFLPASTFKLLNTLIILDAEIVDTIDQVTPWDGVTRSVGAWNQDHSLATGLRSSAVWLFQQHAREVGAEAMTAGVTQSGYGNTNIGGQIDSFWLNGDLRISAVEQVAFLEDLAQQRLPFDVDDQGAVLEAMNVSTRDGYTVHYKTGSAFSNEPPVAWLVGIITTDTNEQWVFAYNTDMAVVDGQPIAPSLDARLAVVSELFETAPTT